MLIELRLRNFIHFEGTVKLKFDKGPYFLLGSNHTGKTSFFEAIRRCMSLSKSNALSNVHNSETFSFASCIFENAETNSTTHSSVIRLQTTRKLPVIIKIVQHRSSDGKVEKAADVISLQDRKLGNLPIDIDTDFDDKLLQKLNKKEIDEPDIKDIGDYLCKFETSEPTSSLISNVQEKCEYTETTCEKLLKIHVNNETVILFPFRSFSPFQWTKSKRNLLEGRGQLGDEISLKEEIILWYLKQRDISEEELLTEQKYFQIITGNSGFRFHKVGEKKVGVKNDYFHNTNPDTENLLKIPEGIYEAKSAAIVLAVKQFRTICLDDAERGMHPQMIERLRDLVLQNIQDKVVLIITHHPAFLAPWNISRTFLFRRQVNDNGYKFCIKPFTDDSNPGEKDAHIITSGQFPSLFFAERICLVEGKTESMFMTALKTIFFQDANLFEAFCSSEEEADQFRDFLCTLHFVPMEGEAGKLMFHRICHSINIPHYFILDYDALVNNIPKRSSEPSEENTLMRELQPFCDEFDIKDIDLSQLKSKHEFIEKIETHDIFVWKCTDELDKTSGSIENAVTSMCEVHKDTLITFLKENNVDIQMFIAKIKEGGRISSSQSGHDIVTGKTKSKGRKKWKLFKAKQLTNRNIIEVVKKLVELSKRDPSSEFHRLVGFFKNRIVKRHQKIASTSDP